MYLENFIQNDDKIKISDQDIVKTEKFFNEKVINAMITTRTDQRELVE